MSSQVRELMASGFGQLRHEPTAKRIQAVLGGDTIVDSTRAVLVWEPRRIVPSYAVPAEDVRGDLVPAGAAAGVVGGDVGVALADVTALRVLDPRVPFTAHSTAGEAVDLRAAGQVRPGRLPPGRPGPGRAGDPRLRRLRRLVRRGRAERGPPAGPVPPDRRAAQLPPGPAGAGRPGAGGQLPAGAAVRDHAACPLLPAAGGRRRRAGAQPHHDLVRVQGRGVLLLRLGPAAGSSRTSPGATRIRSTTRPGSAT